jgi:hypothetical protein
MTYKQIIEKITKDLLTDLASLRVWLVIAAYLFNFLTLYLVGWHGVDYKLAGISIALLTAVYTFFFASKHAEAQAKNAAASDDSDDSDDSAKA